MDPEAGAHIVEDRGQRLQLVGQLGPRHRIGAGESDEGNRHLAVFVRGPGEDLCRLFRVNELSGSSHHLVACGQRRCPEASAEQHAVRGGLAQPGRRQLLRRGRGDQDLTGVRCCLGVDGCARPSTAHHQFVVIASDHEQIEHTAVRTDRDGELHPLSVARATRTSDRATHRDGGTAGPLGMLRTVEQHEDRVAAELEHITAMDVAVVDHAGEAVVDHVGQLFGTLPTSRGQPFRERRETGDVGGDQRSDALLVARAWRPSQQRCWHVRPESVVVGLFSHCYPLS